MTPASLGFYFATREPAVLKGYGCRLVRLGDNCLTVYGLSEKHAFASLYQFHEPNNVNIIIVSWPFF